MSHDNILTAEDAPGGFLAIWSDVAEADETDYLHWLTREHIDERLSVDGFVGCRVYRSLAQERRYFIRYALADASVVGSAAYLARLNAPTDWSRRIMPKLGGFVRGGGRVAAHAGKGSGAFCAAIELERRPETEPLSLVRNLAAGDRTASASLLITDAGATGIRTNEKGMRTGDRSFEALLLIEGLDEKAVIAAAAAGGSSAAGRMHQLIFAR